jgi:hypothetical protein
MPIPSLFLLALIGLSLTGYAQNDKTTASVQIRAVLHDPVKPNTGLSYTDKAGAVVQLDFRPHDLTEPLFIQSLNGSLILYDKAVIDPENPAASLAVSLKLPPNLKRAVVIVLPALPGAKTAYRMVLMDDSDEAFPHGESRVLSLINVESAILAGEHKLPVNPGNITKVPSVRKVNDFHMAQTNFYYKHAESWIPFAERQLQYIDACRRIFIIHATPGALQPKVTTIVDTIIGGPPQ